MGEREELIKRLRNPANQFLFDPQVSEEAKKLLHDAADFIERASATPTNLPAFNDLPDDIREALETSIYSTISDEDHWCIEAAENVYEAVREHIRPKLTGITQEWVTRITSREEAEPPVLGAGFPRPTPPEGVTKSGIPLTWGPNQRNGRQHTEWHAPCGCAFHPEPAPHWHPCADHDPRNKGRPVGCGDGDTYVPRGSA